MTAKFFIPFVALTLGLISLPASAADPSDDAVPLYMQANSLITVQSPASTAMEYPEYPPDSPAWMKLAADAWNADGKTRDLVHQAAAIHHAIWPHVTATDRDKALGTLNAVRNIANNTGDAAIYADSQGNPAQAIEELRDLRHLADLLLNSPTRQLVHMLVGQGITALMTNRLQIILSDITLTDDPQNHQALQVQDAYELIAQLQDHMDPQAELAETILLERNGKPLPPGMTQDAVNKILGPSTTKILENNRRVAAELDLTAMSLAAHIFKFQKGRWPNSLDEMIPSYLPAPVVDPWGDGKQPLGYVLLKGALPDGSDRPMVYTRNNSQNGLEYPVNLAMYGYYIAGGKDQGYGQFRDVSRWKPNQSSAIPQFAPLPAPPQP